VAEGICTSKLKYGDYGLAAYGIPRVKDDEPKQRSMQNLQVSQNKVARVLTRCKRSDRVPVQRAGITSGNRMTVATIHINIVRSVSELRGG
jgi:hypothetical protein